VSQAPLEKVFIKDEPFEMKCIIIDGLYPASTIEGVDEYKVIYYFNTTSDTHENEDLQPDVIAYWHAKRGHKATFHLNPNITSTINPSPGEQSDGSFSVSLTPKQFGAEGDYSCKLEVNLNQNHSNWTQVETVSQRIVDKTGFSVVFSVESEEFVLGQPFQVQCSVKGDSLGQVYRYEVTFHYQDVGESEPYSLASYTVDRKFSGFLDSLD